MDNSVLCPGDSFTSDFVVAVTMVIAHPVAMVQAGSMRADTVQEQHCWGWWPCCTQKSLKTLTHGANPPVLPPLRLVPLPVVGADPHTLHSLPRLSLI